MKQIIISTLLLLTTSFLFSQSNDLSIIQLKRGSKLTGNMIAKSYNGFTLTTSLHDTLEIRNRSVKRLYVVEENFDEIGDVPVMIRGRYYTFFVSTGGGRQRINPQNSPFMFFFPGSTPVIPVTRYSPLILARFQASMGYQFNRHFGLGAGLMFRYNSVNVPNDISLYAGSSLRAFPYIEGKFTYPLEKYGNKDIWVTVNAFQHTEVVVGLSFLQPKRRLNVGIGFFKSFNSFRADSYLSIQAGVQL